MALFRNSYKKENNDEIILFSKNRALALNGTGKSLDFSARGYISRNRFQPSGMVFYAHFIKRYVEVLACLKTRKAPPISVARDFTSLTMALVDTNPLLLDLAASTARNGTFKGFFFSILTEDPCTYVFNPRSVSRRHLLLPLLLLKQYDAESRIKKEEERGKKEQ